MVLVSAASVWEIAVKRALGKLAAPDDLLAEVRADGFTELPITADHAMRAGGLPPHHRDPFDRMLVAQAEIDSHTIVTGDQMIARYAVATLW